MEKWVKITFSCSLENRESFYIYLEERGLKPWEWFQEKMNEINGEVEEEEIEEQKPIRVEEPPNPEFERLITPKETSNPLDS